MSTPLIESIAANILTTINGITTGNGYNQTLIGHRPRRIDFVDQVFGDLDVFITQSEMTEDGSGVNPAATWIQHFDIEALVIDSDTATDPIDTRINQVAADIMKALMVDPHRGQAAGVVDTTIHSAAMLQDESGVSSGVVIDISVHYRTQYNNPYTAI